MGRLAGWAAGVAVAGLLTASSACGAGSEDDGDSRSSGDAAGSCAALYTYEKRTYRQVVNIGFTATRDLGLATRPPCDDTGGDASSGASAKQAAYAVKGISPAIAIAVGENPESAGLFAVYSGSKLPREVRELGEAD